MMCEMARKAQERIRSQEECKLEKEHQKALKNAAAAAKVKK